MQICLNNEWEESCCNTLYELLMEKAVAEKTGMAVALNNNVIPKSQWETTHLQNNDNILLIQATAGG